MNGRTQRRPEAYPTQQQRWPRQFVGLQQARGYEIGYGLGHGEIGFGEYRAAAAAVVQHQRSRGPRGSDAGLVLRLRGPEGHGYWQQQINSDTASEPSR